MTTVVEANELIDRIADEVFVKLRIKPKKPRGYRIGSVSVKKLLRLQESGYKRDWRLFAMSPVEGGGYTLMLSAEYEKPLLVRKV